MALFFKKNFFYILLLVFIFFLFKTFLYTYIIIKSDYNQRMLKYGGLCNDQAYGFVKFINSKYSKLDINFNVSNYSDNPSSYGYFYNIKKKTDINYQILVGISEIELKKFLHKKNFYILEKNNNCYFIKIND